MTDTLTWSLAISGAWDQTLKLKIKTLSIDLSNQIRREAIIPKVIISVLFFTLRKLNGRTFSQDVCTFFISFRWCDETSHASHGLISLAN